MKTGIFGGSFDPVHPGHIAVATAALEECGLDEVWLMMSPQNPLKTGFSPASETDRLAMLRLAIEDSGERADGRLFASDLECSLPRPSYTVHTLRALQELYPDREFILIIGEDNFRNFSRWRAHDEIIRDFGLIVYPRLEDSEICVSSSCAENLKIKEGSGFNAGHSVDPDGKIGRGIVYTLKGVRLYPVSSTRIRNAVGNSSEIPGCDTETLRRHLTAYTFPSVADYIVEKGLYRKNDAKQ